MPQRSSAGVSSHQLCLAALDAAVAGAAKRPLGDSWAWARRGLSVDISPMGERDAYAADHLAQSR